MAKNNILLMSFKRTLDICVAEINWKLNSIDLTQVSHIKDKKLLLEFQALNTVLGPFSW